MHKTGSSSIQQTLSKLKTSDEYHYVTLDSPNHGGNIFTMFTESPEKYHAWKKLGLSSFEIDEIINRTRIQLIKNFSKINSSTFIISGEDIANLSELALSHLKDFLENYFDTIQVIAYVRTPKSYIISSFQQSVKGRLNRFNLKDLYPFYRDKFEKFDNVFNRENVILKYFTPDNLYKRDVVKDICQEIGIDVESVNVSRVNDSLTLEAVQLLYCYRKYGPSYGKGKHSIRENNTIVKAISVIGTTKFSFSDSAVESILLEYKDDIEWIENRLNTKFISEENRDSSNITCEDDLLKPSQQAIAELKKVIGTDFLPSGVNGNTCQEVALLMQALRFKVIYRYNNLLNNSNINKETLTSIPTEESSMVHVGKDHYMFLFGGKHQVVNFFTGEKKPSQDSISNFWNNIEYRTKLCKIKNVEFKHFVFPEKIYLARSKLDIDVSSLYLRHYIESPLQASNVLYLLDSCNNSHELCHKTDTHLNLFGNLAVLREIIQDENAVNDYIELINNKLFLDENCGDLGLKLNPQKTELIVDYDTPEEFEVERCHNGIQGGNNGIIDILINKNAIHHKKVLIFGDSFFRSMLKHLSYFYTEIVFCRTGNFHKEVFDLYKPEVVFSGNAERYLSNVKKDEEAEVFFNYLRLNFAKTKPTNNFLSVFKLLFSKDYFELVLKSAESETSGADDFKLKVINDKKLFLTSMRKNNFTNLASKEIKERFIFFLSSECFDYRSLAAFFNLRQFFYSEWVESVFSVHENNKSNIYAIRLISKHYQRCGDFDNANIYLNQYFELGGDVINDSGREIIRNCYLSNSIVSVSQDCLSEEQHIEKIYKHELSLLSYDIQRHIAEGVDAPPPIITQFVTMCKAYALKSLIKCDIHKNISLAVSGVKNIAIIGKGMSLKNMSYGKMIDSSDFVIRINHIPSEAEYLDYGSKTDLLLYADHLESKFLDDKYHNLLKLKLSPFTEYGRFKNITLGPKDTPLSYLVELISYRRATTGLRALIYFSLLMEFDNVNAFGFDFYNFNEVKVRDEAVRNSAGMAHEIDYESWYSKNVLTKISNIKFQ